MKTYDLIVLGGGTAGTAAAREATRCGARVAMFNDGELGGLCILRGCMPTKTMLHAAHLVHEARHSDTSGVRTHGADVDFAAVMANKDAKVQRFKNAKIEGIEKDGYDVIDARARFTGPDSVEAGGETYRFDKGAVIATGSTVKVPPVPGIDDVDFLTSDEVMLLTERPQSAIVMGSGAIGLELGQFFSRMGTKVQLVSRSRVFGRVDPLFADEMEAALADEPDFELIQPVGTTRVSSNGEGVEVEVEGGRVLRAERLVVATGRVANVEGLGLDVAGVEIERGVIVADAHMRTSNPRVFVAGDASGDRLLLHVANWEGRAAAKNALEGESQHAVEQRLDMAVVFTDPPFARIGLTEGEAEKAGFDPLCAHLKFPETGRAITQDVRHGVIKLVAEPQRGEILGGQVLGPRADDLVHVVSSIMYYRGTAEDMLSMPWYHPTLSEVLLSLASEIHSKVHG